MRPHKLLLKAFGPFAKETIVDFDAMGNNIYLISGDTGAGKTTIFDGIIYALYGKASGDARTKNLTTDEFHSDYAKDGNRREEMRDYVRGLMKQAHEEGTPLLRAMFYEFPEDGECVDLKDQYMFGDKYLVAPVLEAGARSRSVYLPAGEWKNVETGEILTGGKRVDVAAPLEIIPVFEKL